MHARDCGVVEILESLSCVGCNGSCSHRDIEPIRGFSTPLVHQIWQSRTACLDVAKVFAKCPLTGAKVGDRVHTYVFYPRLARCRWMTTLNWTCCVPETGMPACGIR